jgi:hypothetical protein
MLDSGKYISANLKPDSKIFMGLSGSHMELFRYKKEDGISRDTVSLCFFNKLMLLSVTFQQFLIRVESKISFSYFSKNFTKIYFCFPRKLSCENLRKIKKKLTQVSGKEILSIIC